MAFIDSPVWAFSCLVLAIGYMERADGDLAIDVSPTEFVLGLSTSLEVNCSFSIDNTSSLAAIISLVIARSNDFNRSFSNLAVVNVFAPHEVNLLTKESVAADGFLDVRGETFLYLRWHLPSIQQSGHYRCSAHGIDDIGLTGVLSDSAQANFSQPGLSDYVDKIREISLNMTQAVKTMKESRSSLECSGLEMDAYSTILENAMADMNSVIKSLTEQVSMLDNDAKMLDIASSEADIYQKALRVTIFRNDCLLYKDRRYCLSHDKFRADVAAAVCMGVRGYLVQLDDLEEYQAIQAFLQTQSNGSILIAGSDAITEGHWVFTSTNQSVPVLDWYDSDPDGGTSQNCLILVRALQWRMIDVSCQKPHSFVCEIA